VSRLIDAELPNNHYAAEHEKDGKDELNAVMADKMHLNVINSALCGLGHGSNFPANKIELQ
jgi:hypothetical protein